MRAKKALKKKIKKKLKNYFFVQKGRNFLLTDIFLIYSIT